VQFRILGLKLHDFGLKMRNLGLELLNLSSRLAQLLMPPQRRLCLRRIRRAPDGQGNPSPGGQRQRRAVSLPSFHCVHQHRPPGYS
jgi:hypothetical protein